MTIAEGEFVVVHGRSGAGKTTLLSLAGGLDRPDEGRVCALDNVALGLRIQGEPRSRHRALELSGGEQQRVALARALVKRPRLLLADEPTGRLDTQTARQVIALARAAAASGTTVLVASHDEALVEVADRAVRLRDGTIEAS